MLIANTRRRRNSLEYLTDITVVTAAVLASARLKKMANWVLSRILMSTKS